MTRETRQHTANRPVLVRVWDPFVRVFHWGLAVSFAVAWFTAHSWEEIHHWAGYAAAALVVVRLVWGIMGTRYARFSGFVRNPREIVAYLGAIATGSEARHIGHNPAGGAMIVVLILAMGATALTGWLTTTDQFWGVAWVQKLHDLLAHGLLVLIALHLAGVAVASIRHRENLVLAMVSGRKRSPEPGDVD
jgi:cytochrome b